jgi:hypothetical protein
LLVMPLLDLKCEGVERDELLCGIRSRSLRLHRPPGS